MRMYSTKDAAGMLQVSPTTIKRWASQFQSRFTKDELGHYVFDDSDMERLAFIKKQLEMKLSLSQIVLDDAKNTRQQTRSETAGDEPSPGKEAPSVSRIAAQCGEIENKLKVLEYKLSEKADDIVSVQLLEHRREIDELTSSVKRLSEHMEEVACSLSKLRSESEAPEYRKPPAKRRRLLASLFQL